MCKVTSVTRNNQSFVEPGTGHVHHTKLRGRLHKLCLHIVLIFYVCLSSSLSTAQEEGDPLPSLLCFNCSHWLSTVWIQHRGHQCTRGGVCMHNGRLVLLMFYNSTGNHWGSGHHSWINNRCNTQSYFLYINIDCAHFLNHLNTFILYLWP